jgi:hypothetical protein
MVRVLTAKDGNCFYHALLYTLWKKGVWDNGPQSTGPVKFSLDDINRVKAQLLTTFENQSLDTKRLLEQREVASSPLTTRLQPCRTEGCGSSCWATDAEIILASRKFVRQICIFSKSSKLWACFPPGGHVEFKQDAPNDTEALLLFYTDNHYDALIPSRPKAAPVDRRKERDAFKRGAALGVVALALGLAALRRRP